MLRILLVLALVASMSIPMMEVQTAHGCSCVPLSTAEYIENADVVLIGDVEAVVHSTPGPSGRFSSIDPAFVSVTVKRYLKGSGDQTIEFMTARSGASCGALEAIDAGTSNVLFLRDDGETLSTSLCSGNQPMVNTSDHAQQEENEFLGEVQSITGPGAEPGGVGQDIEPTFPTGETAMLRLSAILGIAVGSAAGLLGVGFLLWKALR